MPSNFKRPTAAVQKQVPGTGCSKRRMDCSRTDDPTGGGGADPAESLPDKSHRYGRRFVAKNKNTRRSTVLPREAKIGLISGAGVYGSLLRQGDNDLIIWKLSGEDSNESKKKRLHLDEQAKQICLNVYNNLLKEKEAG
jgi:hypothetical protein